MLFSFGNKIRERRGGEDDSLFGKTKRYFRLIRNLGLIAVVEKSKDKQQSFGKITEEGGRERRQFYLLRLIDICD